MSQQQTDLAWRVGGPQGQGVDTAAVLFARACIMGAGLFRFPETAVLPMPWVGTPRRGVRPSLAARSAHAPYRGYAG